MKLKSKEIYHVYNRGNNRQRLFYEEANYHFFIEKVRKYIFPYCDILAYCLMPNHFHFLIHANARTNVLYYRKRSKAVISSPLIKMTRFSKGLQLLLSSYAKAMNRKYARSGSLFRQNTKSKRTSSGLFLEDYSLQCFIYVHNNPVAAGLVQRPEDWAFSSARDYLGLRDGDSLCNLEMGRKLLNLDMNEIRYLNSIVLPPEVIRKIFK